MTTRRPAPPSQKRSDKLNNFLAEMVIRGRNSTPERRRKSTKSRSLTPTPMSVKQEEVEIPAPASGSLKVPLALSLVDFSFVLSLVFGGCCANVWAYEYLLKIDSHMGAALTFSQMAFVTLTSLPSFLTWKQSSILIPIPTLKPRQVPLSQWAIQVVVLTAGSLLNNWAFAFKVPLTVQIVFRSAGLGVSMLFGRLFMKKQYSLKQMGAVLLVSMGVLLATTARPSAASTKARDDYTQYTIGVIMLTVSLFLTGLLGLLQERAYTQYGPCWREGVFYTHFLSLPIFAFLIPDIKRGFSSLTAASDYSQFKDTISWIMALEYASQHFPQTLRAFSPYLMLFGNLLTQLICVSGVNQLTSRVSSVSTNLVLTTRKAISLCFSVWWFGNGWNGQLGVGAALVFFGSLLYTFVTPRSSAPSIPPKTAPEVIVKHEKED